MERLINLCPPMVGRWWRLLEQSPVGGRLARGAFWNLAGTGISRGLTLVSSMVVARMLGKEAFGQLGVIQSTVGMFGVLAGVGMGLTATKHIAEHRTSNPARASRILSGSFTMAAVSGVLVTLLLLATAPWLARNVLASADMASLLRVGTFLVLLGAVNAVQTGALAGFEAFKTIAWVNFWSGLISFPCMLAGAYFAGVSGAVWGMVASTAFNAWLNDRALRRHARAAGLDFRLRWADGETALLWNFSLPSLLSSLVGWAGNWGCAAILVNSAGGYGEMGIVNAANQWRQALMFIPGLVINTLLPVLANEHRGPGRNYERALNYSHSFLNLIMLPLAALLMLAAKPILLTYGRGFGAGRMALVLVLAGTGISAVSSPIGCVIISTGRMWASFLLGFANAAVFAGCTWLLAESCGAAGLGLGLLAGQTLQAVAGICLFRDCLPALAIRRNLVSIAVILVICAALGWIA